MIDYTVQTLSLPRKDSFISDYDCTAIILYCRLHDSVGMKDAARQARSFYHLCTILYLNENKTFFFYLPEKMILHWKSRAGGVGGSSGVEVKDNFKAKISDPDTCVIVSQTKCL